LTDEMRKFANHERLFQNAGVLWKMLFAKNR